VTDDFKNPHGRFTESNIDRNHSFYRRRQQGETLSSIAKSYGVSKETVRRTINRYQRMQQAESKKRGEP